MKRAIELKHVGPKAHVRNLIDTLIDRVEERLHHFPSDAVSLHAMFQENGSHTLYRASVTCHIPRHLVATHEEARDPGTAIRKAFSELERQLEKHTARLRRQIQRRRPVRGMMIEPAEG